MLQALTQSRSLLSQARKWFEANGYEVGSPLIWNTHPEGRARSDFRVTPPGGTKEVAALILTSTRADSDRRLTQWLRIQKRPGVYVVTEHGFVSLAHSCPGCNRLTQFEFLASLEVSRCIHTSKDQPPEESLIEDTLLKALYEHIRRAPEAAFPGDLDAGMKLSREEWFEIKPLHFGRSIGVPASQIRSLLELAGGYGLHDKFAGHNEKVWRIPRELPTGGLLETRVVKKVEELEEIIDPIELGRRMREEEEAMEQEQGIEPWTFDEEPI